MSEKIALSPSDVDAALLEVRKSIESEKITIEKAVVDARANGGETKTEPDFSSGGGRKDKEVPATRGVDGNFATKYQTGNEPLAAAVAENAKNDDPNRGLTKAVDEKSSASSVAKAVDEKSSASSKSSVKKAMSSSSSDSSASSASDKKFKKFKKFKKALDDKSSASSKSSVAKAVDPNENVKKSIEHITEAQKSITKAYENGSANDLNVAGEHLISAKQAITKAIAGGEEVSKDTLYRLDKSAKYFSKAIEAYENDDMEGHAAAIAKTEKNISKALGTAVKEEVKVEAPIVKSVDTEVTFVKEGDKYVAAMDEATFNKVSKALNEKGLYKSLGDTLTEEKKTIEATPILKGLVDKLSSSHDSMRDAFLDAKENDRSFKKALLKSFEALSDKLTSTTAEVEALKATPKLRKSVTTEVKSPLDAGNAGVTFSKSMVSDILAKGVANGQVDTRTVLAWDVDKDYVDEVPAGLVEICNRIQGGFKN